MQLAPPAATAVLVEQVVPDAIAKSLLLAPVTAILVKVKFTFPLLVTVKL